jgi:hypothetical protein
MHRRVLDPVLLTGTLQTLRARPHCRAFCWALKIEPKQVRISTVTDQPEANNTAPDDAPEAVEKKPRPYGKRNPDAVIEERRKRLYKRQLTGLTVRQLVLEHSDRESIAEATAWRDWDEVKVWMEEDWKKDRESIVSRLQSMRLRAIDAAIRKGQIGSAQLLMRDLGAVVGEVAPEAAAAAAPRLEITVEDRRQS